MASIPLFPLHLVLFPGAQLPLRIFETRYIDLVSECLRTDRGFGVCLIEAGSETGGGARCHAVGSYAKIIDWSQMQDGLLGISIQAESRFRVRRFSTRSNNLLEGDIDWLGDDHNEAGEKFADLRELLLKVLEHFDLHYENQKHLLTRASWLGFRLAELLPLANHDKQVLLELDDSEERLLRLQRILQENEKVKLEP